ncbi:MAG: hypothetical protein ABI690_33125 [Chloroflexota bacterium]
MTNLNYGQAHKQIEKRRRSRFFFRLHILLFVIGMILFFFWLRGAQTGNPVYLLPPTLWAFLLIGHWFYHSTASTQDGAMENLWENVYGARPGETAVKTDPYSDVPSIESIRRSVEAELTREKTKRRRLFFRVNVAVYLAVMLLGWIIIPIIHGPFLTESASATILALSIGGLLEVILHYRTIRMDSAEGEQALRERLLVQAIQQAMLEGRYPEKAKRTSRLSDDGELIEIDYGDEDESLKNQMSGV